MAASSLVDQIHVASERRRLIVLVWLAIIPPGLLTLQDAAAGVGVPQLLIRALPTLVGAGALLVIALTGARTAQVIIDGIVVILTMSLLVSNAARPESEVIPLRGRMLGPMLIYLLAPGSMLIQAGSAIGLSVGLAVLRIVRVDPFEPWAFANDGLFMVILNVAGVLLLRSRLDLQRSLDQAWHNENASRVAAEKARADVRTLEGIIPICMHCRKLRTEAGDWQQLESYVNGRTGAEFSHGICHECLEAHYSEQRNP